MSRVLRLLSAGSILRSGVVALVLLTFTPVVEAQTATAPAAAAPSPAPAAKSVLIKASADTDEPPPPPEPPRVYDPQPWSRLRCSLTLGTELGVGAYTGDQSSPGFLTDLKLDALLHFRHFTLGVIAEGGTVNFTNYDWIAGLTGGPAWNVGRGRVLALAEVGIHQIGGIGTSLFGAGALSNVTAIMPVAGVNVRYVLVGAASGTVSFVTIFEVFGRFDLERVKTQYQAQVLDSSGGYSLSTIPATVGGSAAGGGVSIGALF